MHFQRLAIGVMSALGVLAAALPWVAGMNVEVTGIGLWYGWIVGVVFSLACVVAVIGGVATPPGRAQLVAFAAVGAAAAIYGSWKIVEIRRGELALTGELADFAAYNLHEAFVREAAPGYGLFLLVAVGIALVLLSTSGLVRRRP